MTRYDELTKARESLLGDMESAEYELDMAKEALYRVAGTRAEASAQAERSRAEAHYEAAEQALSDWLESDDGIEWAKLDEVLG